MIRKYPCPDLGDILETILLVNRKEMIQLYFKQLWHFLYDSKLVEISPYHIHLLKFETYYFWIPRKHTIQINSYIKPS